MRKEGGRGRDGRSGLEGGGKTKATWSERHMLVCHVATCVEFCLFLRFDLVNKVPTLALPWSMYSTMYHVPPAHSSSHLTSIHPSLVKALSYLYKTNTKKERRHGPLFLPNFLSFLPSFLSFLVFPLSRTLPFILSLFKHQDKPISTAASKIFSLDMTKSTSPSSHQRQHSTHDMPLSSPSNPRSQHHQYQHQPHRSPSSSDNFDNQSRARPLGGEASSSDFGYHCSQQPHVDAHGRDYHSHNYNALLPTSSSSSSSSIPGSHYYSSYSQQQQQQLQQDFFQRRASDQSSSYHQSPAEHFDYSGSRRVSLSSLGRPHDYSPPFQSNPTSPLSPTLPSPCSRSPRTPPLTPMALSPRKQQIGRQARPRPIVTRKATGGSHSSTTTGGGGGGSGGGPNRRLAHILSEQKRREKINGGFDELKSVVPE